MAAKKPTKGRRKGFASSLNASPKSNNTESAVKHKIELRRLVLNEIGPENARVFDVYAGAGEMYKGAWQDAAQYAGCDREFYRDEREMFVCDNRRLLRCLDLTQFNIFDVDAYGSPWECALIIAARRPVAPGETIGMVLTDGLAIGGRLNATSNGFRILTGVTMRAGMSRDYERLHRMGVHALAERMQARLMRQWLLKGRYGRMHYSAIILRGVAEQPEAETAQAR